MPPSSADGSQDARSFFKCIACELVFHGDCEGLSVGEKKVAQKVSSMSQKDRAKLGAICLRCSISARAVWRAATQDACKITELLSVLGANKMRRAQVIKLAKKFEVPELAGELLEYHVKYHEPPEAEGEEARIALIKELEELSSDILLSRVPDGNLTDERMWLQSSSAMLRRRLQSRLKVRRSRRKQRAKIQQCPVRSRRLERL